MVKEVDRLLFPFYFWALIRKRTMKILQSTLFFILVFFAIGCGESSEKEKSKSENPWIGTWQMVGYDDISVEKRDTLVIMLLNDQNKIKYITQTRQGEVLLESEGDYSINDQHSVITVAENGQNQTEYFIRKVDQDSLIFQSDTFSIKWKRID